MAQQATILGDGQMALVLSDVLIENGMHVRMWCPFKKTAEVLSQSRVSDRLPNFTLDKKVEVVDDDASALQGAELVVNAIPTQFVRSVWERVGGNCPLGVPVACVSKGIEIQTLLRPSEIIEQAVDSAGGGRPRVCALSGPTIASELAEHKPATLVAASADADVAAFVQASFLVKWLRVYKQADLIGVELAGATKNIIALAAGMIDGLQLGDNAKSALLARGLAEIARLGVAMGARVETFFGIAGVGDLATTCFSPFGRNRTCGERLGRGESLESIHASTNSVIEGVSTTESVSQLASQISVEMPITEAVHQVLFGGVDPLEGARALMLREVDSEEIG